MQIVLVVLTALIAVIIAYGAIGASIIGLLGPIFIPWMVFPKTDFLFWGWLKAFLGFEFYKVDCCRNNEHNEPLAHYIPD